MTRAASMERLLPLPATKEWGEGRGEGRPCKHCTKTTLNRFKAPLSLALSPLRRERVFAAPCSPSYGLLRNWGTECRAFAKKCRALRKLKLFRKSRLDNMLLGLGYCEPAKRIESEVRVPLVGTITSHSTKESSGRGGSGQRVGGRTRSGGEYRLQGIPRINAGNRRTGV